MSNDLATIKFNGEMELSDFSEAMSRFEELMSAIATAENRKSKLRWRVQELRTGSLTAIVCADSEDETEVERVIGMYEEIGRCAASGIAPPFGGRVADATRKLCKLINGHITSIDFGTGNVFYEAVSPIESHVSTPSIAQRTSEAYGSVRGRAETVSNRHGLHFTLFDINDDHAIDCYVNEDLKSAMREAWDQMCIVSGIVRRHANGQIASVRAISKITVLEETTKDSWRDAIGCAPAIPGSISIEEAVRRVREDE